jgi:hypothetical protein
MSNSWIQALKIYNKDKNAWCLPRKNTREYNEVKQIQNNLSGRNKKPEVKKPEVKKPKVKKPEVKKPEVKKPEVKKPDIKLKKEVEIQINMFEDDINDLSNHINNIHDKEWFYGWVERTCNKNYKSFGMCNVSGQEVLPMIFNQIKGKKYLKKKIEDIPVIILYPALVRYTERLLKNIKEHPVTYLKSPVYGDDFNYRNLPKDILNDIESDFRVSGDTPLIYTKEKQRDMKLNPEYSKLGLTAKPSFYEIDKQKKILSRIEKLGIPAKYEKQYKQIKQYLKIVKTPFYI